MATYLKKQPLLNHKSEMYDANCHVRVRLLSSTNLPIKFDKCLRSDVKEDSSSELLKPKTYTNKIESLKTGVSGIFSSREPPLDRFKHQSKEHI